MLKVSRLLFQNDGSACGIWLQVARDVYLEYMASSEYGSGSFLTFLERRMEEMGVRHLRGASTKQRRANQTFILEQRAEMRARLVQAALEGKLKHGAAELEGFCLSTGIDVEPADLEELDDVVEGS